MFCQDVHDNIQRTGQNSDFMNIQRAEVSRGIKASIHHTPDMTLYGSNLP